MLPPSAGGCLTRAERGSELATQPISPSYHGPSVEDKGQEISGLMSVFSLVGDTGFEPVSPA